MKFGPLPLSEAEGAVLAHSVTLGGRRFKKGRVLSAADVEAMRAAGAEEAVVARLEETDVPEDEAAARVAAAVAPNPAALGLSVSSSFTGRVNLYADAPGVLEVDAARVHALNALDEAVTLATLEPHARVGPRQMVGTVKIIPYAAPRAAVEEAERLAAEGPLMRLHPVALGSASLVCTRTPGMSDAVVEKGAKAVRDRLAALGLALADETVVAHDTAAIAEAVTRATGDMVLILTGSATSDRADLGPAGVEAAGGRLLRFGMPVDPGNLLFLAETGTDPARPVVGLPGCARSPKLNGADWVLERLACGLPVGDGEIATMGVGGLLKEIASRPAPRAGGGAAEAPTRPVVSALLLAAGSASRMRGTDKLLETVDGTPLIARMARRLADSGADETVVVLREGDETRARALSGTGARTVANPRAGEGMGTSIAAGIAALRPDADAAVIVLADMPELTGADIDRLVAAYDPEEGRAIVRATGADGTPGHPVLFGRRFFELLRGLEGDRGAREILRDYADFVTEVALPGRAAVTDLDTPEDWAEWRRREAVPAGEEG